MPAWASQAPPSILVSQGEGSTLSGQLRGDGGGIDGAALCVFSTVVTDSGREFLGMAMSGPGGAFQFSLPPGPSRHPRVQYRGDQR